MESLPVKERRRSRPGWQWAYHWSRRLCMGIGMMALVMLGLAFTGLPFRAHRWLGISGGLFAGTPGTIILLGGSGMPSGPELMRCHATALLGRQSPMARVLLVLPVDTGLAQAMVHELGLKGIPSSRIDLVMHGRNTREQALDVAAKFPGTRHCPTAVVTAPENMYRTLRAFRKVGFTEIAGVPAFDHALFDDLDYHHSGIGGKPYVPDVSGSMDLRYNIWNRLKLEITCLREYAAIGYYELNGWI